MRHQIIEITNQYPYLPSYTTTERIAPISNNDGLYWIGIYTPMESDQEVPVVQSRQLCPWSMAAELSSPAIAIQRRQLILNSFKNGQRAMKQFGLPSNRILFLEDHNTRKITVWID